MFADVILPFASQELQFLSDDEGSETVKVKFGQPNGWNLQLLTTAKEQQLHFRFFP